MASRVHERTKKTGRGEGVSRSENRPTKSFELNYRILSERPWEPTSISADIVPEAQITRVTRLNKEKDVRFLLINLFARVVG